MNRALSTANSALYGVCQAAIVSAGFSPALGFIHTGKMLSFVYDVADLYKAEVTIPLAFAAVAESEEGLEGRVRRSCRDAFQAGRLLQRIIPDLDRVLALEGIAGDDGVPDFDADPALPGGLWDPETGLVAGGVNRAGDAAGSFESRDSGGPDAVRGSEEPEGPEEPEEGSA